MRWKCKICWKTCFSKPIPFPTNRVWKEISLSPFWGMGHIVHKTEILPLLKNSDGSRIQQSTRQRVWQKCQIATQNVKGVHGIEFFPSRYIFHHLLVSDSGAEKWQILEISAEVKLVSNMCRFEDWLTQKWPFFSNFGKFLKVFLNKKSDRIDQELNDSEMCFECEVWKFVSNM